MVNSSEAIEDIEVEDGDALGLSLGEGAAEFDVEEDVESAIGWLVPTSLPVAVAVAMLKMEVLMQRFGGGEVLVRTGNILFLEGVYTRREDGVECYGMSFL